MMQDESLAPSFIRQAGKVFFDDELAEAIKSQL